MYTIEKGIPWEHIQRSGRPKGTVDRYPWKHMVPGDSFLVPNADVFNLRTIGDAGRQYSHRHHDGKVKFLVVPLPEGVRVWRIA